MRMKATLSPFVAAVMWVAYCVLRATIPAAADGAQRMPTAGGVAVVIGGAAAATTALPELARLRAEPGAVASGYRSDGLHVETDPTGMVLAVKPPTRLTGADVASGVLGCGELATALVQQATAEQLALRSHGYLTADGLPEQQLSVLRQMSACRYHGAGRNPRGAGPFSPADLQIGVWVTELSVPRADGRPTYMWPPAIRPPTPETCPGPLLAGSVLWWESPHVFAEWGDTHVTVEPGVYGLGDLFRIACGRTDVDMIVSAAHEEDQVAVVADKVPIRCLVWAAEVATGLPVKPVPGSVPVILQMGSADVGCYAEFGHPNRLFPPFPSIGYWVPAPGCYLAEEDRAFVGPEGDAYWLGWRYSDLSLLYRNWVREQWVATGRQGAANDEAIDATLGESYVIWRRCVDVDVSGTRGNERAGGVQGHWYLPLL
jgi:hypothetical protein